MTDLDIVFEESAWEKTIASLNPGDSLCAVRLLTLRYGLEGGAPLTPEQTGKELGMTPQEVVAAEAAALSKLRKQ